MREGEGVEMVVETERSYWQDFLRWEAEAAARGSGMTAEQKTGAAMFRSWLVNEAPDDETPVRSDELARLRRIEAACADVMAEWDAFIVARVGSKLAAQPLDLMALADAILPLRAALDDSR